MSPRVQEHFKTWLNPIVTILTGVGVIWVIMSSVVGTVNSGVKELHKNTADVWQLQKDFADHKTDAQVRRDKIDAHEQQQDAKIDQNSLDIAVLQKEN